MYENYKENPLLFKRYKRVFIITSICDVSKKK